jgi:hypothetical protein
MAKRSGLGMRMYVDGVRISGDVGAIDNLSGGPALLESPCIENEAMVRLTSHRQGGITFASYFNDATGAVFPTLKALPTTDRAAMATLGAHAYAIVGKQLNFDHTRGEDGSLIANTEVQSNGFGAEWGDILTGTATNPERTDTAATNGTGVDRWDGVAGSSLFGAQMYVQLIAFTGTSVTIKVQSSTDNGAGDAFADVTGLTTSAMAAIGAERAATAAGATIERYLRVVTTGTFSEAVFVVSVVRNLSATAF